MRHRVVSLAVAGAIAAGLFPSVASASRAASPERAQAAQFAPFVGTWERRDAWLTVFEDGSAAFRWKVGFCMPTDPPPCDFVDQNGNYQPGGRVEIRFSRVQDGEPPIAEGQVLASNGRFEPGPIWLVRASPDLVALTQYVAPTSWLCREPRDINHCL